MPIIRLMVTRLGGTPDDSRDIFQDGLIIMLEKIDDRNFTLTCRFKTYLYSVCENLWKEVLEKRKAAANYFIRNVDPEDNHPADDQIDNKLYQDIFRESYESLEPGSRNILKLYWEELSPQEIADKLGVTNGYVRKKKCEAQAELIEKVKKHPDYLKVKNSEIVAKGVVF